MRILMISDVYFPRINGVSTSIQTFRREFEQKGHQVHLLAPDYGNLEQETGGVQRIPSRHVWLDPEDRMMKMPAIDKLTAELRNNAYDIVHIQTPFTAHYAGVKLSRRLNLPRVESYHTFFEEYLYNYVPFLPKGWLRLAARRFSKWQCNDVDAVAVPSSAMLDVLHAYGVRTHAAIIPTGLELERFQGGDGVAFRARYGIPVDRPVLVHIGRIAFEKNIHFLLHVTRAIRMQIPDVLLVIAGEGPARKSLQRQAEKLGLANNVLFVGYLSRESGLLDCYRAGDVFVFASRTETQGLVLLEAMALGVPVVSTAVMGTRDVLKPESGALVAQEEVGDFSAKVVGLLNDPDQRARLSQQHTDYIHQWSAPALADKMLDFYAEVIDKCRAGKN